MAISKIIKASSLFILMLWISQLAPAQKKDPSFRVILKKNKDSVLVNKGISSKTGISARLRAQRGEDGKIKITWDPFNKAGKAIKNQQSAKPLLCGQ